MAGTDGVLEKKAEGIRASNKVHVAELGTLEVDRKTGFGVVEQHGHGRRLDLGERRQGDGQKRMWENC